MESGFSPTLCFMRSTESAKERLYKNGKAEEKHCGLSP